MADESSVYITGSEPDWAVQKALDSILAELQSTQKVTKEQEKILKKSTSGGKVFDKQAWKEWTSGLKKATQQGVKQGRANKGLIDSTKDLSKEFKETSKTFKGVMVGAGLLAGGFGMVYEQFKASVETFTALNEFGLSTSLTYRSLSENLARTGMSLKTFEDITAKYSALMGGMGSNSFIRTLTSVGDGFNKFGLTMSEGAEWAAEYLQQQRSLGNYSIYNQRNMNEAVRSNIDRLTAYSKVLNISRSELQASATAGTQDDEIAARLSTYGMEQREAITNALTMGRAGLSGFGAGGLADVYQAGFRRLTSIMNEEVQGLLNTGTEFGADFVELIDMAREGYVPTRQDLERLGFKHMEWWMEDGGQLLQTLPDGDAKQGMLKIADFMRGFQEYLVKFPTEEARDAVFMDTQTNAIVDAAANLRQNLSRLESSVVFFMNDIVETLIGILGITDTESGGTSVVRTLAGAAGSAADALIAFANAEGEWSENRWATLFGKIGTMIWDGISASVERIWNAGVAKITEKLEEIKNAIANWSPFRNNETYLERKYGEGATEASVLDTVGLGSSSQSTQLSFLIDEAREELALAQRDLRIAQSQQTMGVAMSGQGAAMAAARAIGKEADANARIEEILSRIERLQRDRNLLAEDGNG